MQKLIEMSNIIVLLNNKMDNKLNRSTHKFKEKPHKITIRDEGIKSRGSQERAFCHQRQHTYHILKLSNSA